MSDIKKITGEPITVRAAGRELKVARYTPRILGKLQEWIEANLHPLAKIRKHLKHLLPAQQTLVLEATARESVHFNASALDNQTASEMIMHPDGLIVFLRNTLEKHNPDLDFESLADELSLEEIADILGAVNGERPEDRQAKKEDPNA